MALADAPAVQKNPIAALESRIAGGLYGTRKVDARHHGKLTNHRSLAGNCERIFVVERRVVDSHADIARRQLSFIDGLDAGAVRLRVALNENCLEHDFLGEWDSQ